MIYNCKHCGAGFEVKQKLGGHSRTCKSNPRYSENMTQLDKARQNINHDFLVTGYLKKVKCKICDKEYCPTGMSLHMWKIHGEGIHNDPNSGYKNGTRQAWSKGKTKESDPRIASYGRTLSSKMKGVSRPDLRKNTDLKKLSDYRLRCSFDFNIGDYPNEFDFTLIENYGWYSAKNRGNNLNGVSRDHIVSVMFGFENGIDPKIISHPANCQLLKHNDNVSKNKKCGISIDELLDKIQQWDDRYKQMGR